LKPGNVILRRIAVMGYKQINRDKLKIVGHGSKKETARNADTAYIYAV